jgi:hypothetical protein
VWVSRDDAHGLFLADLLKKQLGAAEFKDAGFIHESSSRFHH